MLYPLTYSFSLFNQPKLPSTSNLQQLKKKDVRKICSQFESIFITYLLRQMRKSIPKSDFLEGTMLKEEVLVWQKFFMKKSVIRSQK